MKFLTKTVPLMLLLASAAIAAGDKSVGAKVDDTWIHTKVKSALVGYGSSNINVEVYKGVVAIAGFVDSEYSRLSAGEAAAAVTGVVEVRNHLVVQTASRSAGRALDDGVVATKLKAELAESEITSAFGINVEVRHGVVLLSGFVDTEKERDEALRLAGNMEGVIEVVDGMDIVPAAA